MSIESIQKLFDTYYEQSKLKEFGSLLGLTLAVQTENFEAFEKTEQAVKNLAKEAFAAGGIAAGLTIKATLEAAEGNNAEPLIARAKKPNTKKAKATLEAATKTTDTASN